MQIDYVSAAILVVAFIVSSIRAIPVRLRYGTIAAACAAIAIYRLRTGAAGINALMVLLAGGFAVYYLVRAFRASKER